MAGFNSVPRILVADDDDFVRRFLRDLLTRRGYAVDLVSSGAEALEKAGAGDYSLFVLDHEMGHPTGLEVIFRLRTAGNETPIILMSGSFAMEDLGAPTGPGGVTHLEKPFSGAELEAAVEAAIGKGAR